jgi:Nif-specific regulatory protein
VLKSREAILARDVADDSLLVNRDSLGEIHAKSVICAPIRLGKQIYGLIHLYSTNPERKLEPDDLEYTLAVADQCAGALDNLLRQEKLADGLARVRNENLKLREQLGIESDLVGNSVSIQALKTKIARIAPTDATVLIRGESGVGKELVARAIHFTSRRRNGPFVCMNCAALTESLLESELFGHEKGSFTGATSRKIGKFEQAHKGTIFLDEVGEMGPGIQAKFLRVLEGHPFERVGGNTAIQVEVRVVAATNRDLERAVEGGTFRKDLYFRLHVVEVVVDPLRGRVDDVEVLARHFLKGFAAKTSRNVRDYTSAALDKLMAYDWPGNVRELQNSVERAVILCTGEIVGASDIQLSGLGGGGEEQRAAAANAAFGGFGDVTLEALEQQHILAVLERTNWNKSQAAHILGIERSTLDRKLKRYQVSRPGPG